MYKHLHYLMDTATDGTEGGTAGTAEADRGDLLPEADPAVAAAAEAEAATAAETAASEAAAAEALAAAAAEKPAKDPVTGKFVKKEEKVIGIPKTVFDERLGAERAARLAAEQRAAELQAKIDMAAHSVSSEQLEAEIVALEKNYTKLMMTGEGDKAAETMREIRLKTAEVAHLAQQKESTERTAAQRQQDAIDQEKARVSAVVTSIQADHPEFDENSPSFNQKLVNIVLAEQVRLINEEGLSPSDALQRAANDVTELTSAKTGLDAAVDTGKKTDVKSERKADAVAKAIAASNAQPGSMKEVGIDSDKAGSKIVGTEDASLMTYEEFAALPEATKSKMRGDFI